MAVATSAESLRQLVDAIVANDGALFSKLMDASPELAAASFAQGATRQGASPSFIEEIGQCIYAGDTALHFAAASYRHKMADKLIKAGANVRAKNRRGCEPVHSAAFGSPGSPRWDPPAQVATIACLIGAGADPNAQNMDGQLHCTAPFERVARGRYVLSSTTERIQRSATKTVQLRRNWPCILRDAPGPAHPRRKLSSKRFCCCYKGVD